jgi:hypothetical protein
VAPIEARIASSVSAGVLMTSPCQLKYEGRMPQRRARSALRPAL